MEPRSSLDRRPEACAKIGLLKGRCPASEGAWHVTVTYSRDRVTIVIFAWSSCIITYMSKRQNTLNQNPFIRGNSFEILIETLKSDRANCQKQSVGSVDP